MVTAVATTALLYSSGVAHAESRWDGLYDGTPGATSLWLKLQQNPEIQETRSEQDSDFEFGKKKAFEKKFETDNFKQRLRKTLNPFDRNR